MGFLVAMSALVLLPFYGTDFGKGAIRWFSFDLVTIQPSEFLKPFFMIISLELHVHEHQLTYIFSLEI